MSFGHGEDITELLKTLGPQHAPWLGEVIIVDQPKPELGYDQLLPNLVQSTAISWRDFGWSIRLIQSRDNIGYGRALNLAERLLHPATRWIMVLNPDTRIPTGTLNPWVEHAASAGSRLGILAPSLINGNGRQQRSHYHFPNPFSYWGDHSIFAGALKELIKRLPGKSPVQESHSKESDLAWSVDWVMGAAWLVPHGAWMQLQGFDPSYFLYAEDTDFCWRLKRHHLQILYQPQIQVIHLQGSPSGPQRGRQQVMLFDGLRHFLNRTQTRPVRWAVKGCILLDMTLRILMFSLPGLLNPHSLAGVRLRASTQTLWRTLAGK